MGVSRGGGEKFKTIPGAGAKNSKTIPGAGAKNSPTFPGRFRAEPSRAEPWKTDVDFCAQAAEMVLVAFATLTRFACFEA